ncbi:MAG: RNA-binding S4 domain-containing protein [Ruminococcaceae bacterium]|nr:RNA-binding S4 domain-containing protein [Oscillospiraceae bacterium]
MRLDKFLKVSRVIKRRTVANEACDNGRVSINGRPAKAGTQVKPGDVVTVEFAGGSTKFEILAVEENVKKANATEMYRIITSFVLAVFIVFGTIVGFTGCNKEAETRLGSSYVMTVGDTKVYDEQFCYLFSQTAEKIAGVDYTPDWLRENMDDVIEAAEKYAFDVAALYNSGVESGFELTEEELYMLKNKISDTLLYNLEINQNKDIKTNDEMCLYLTGMNVQEYVRFAVFTETADKYAEHLSADYAPSEQEQMDYYTNNKENFKACNIGMIYISEKSKAEEAFNLLKNEIYPFDIVAKGWSEDEAVLDNSGVITVTKTTDNLPAKVVKWVFSQESSTDSYEMIHVENLGWYILKFNEVLAYENCEELKKEVFETMKEEMISDKIDVYEYDFDRDKASKAVDAFLEDRKI